jgi:hypothetical protein
MHCLQTNLPLPCLALLLQSMPCPRTTVPSRNAVCVMHWTVYDCCRMARAEGFSSNCARAASALAHAVFIETCRDLHLILSRATVAVGAAGADAPPESKAQPRCVHSWFISWCREPVVDCSPGIAGQLMNSATSNHTACSATINLPLLVATTLRLHWPSLAKAL